MNVKFGKTSKECGNVLIGFAQLLLVLTVLRLVATQLLVALEFDALVLAHQLVHLGHKFDTFLLGHDDFVLIVDLNPIDLFLSLD